MIQRTQGNTQRIAIAVEKAELNKDGDTPEEAEQIREERARVEREKLAQMNAEAMQADNTPAEE